MWVVMELLPRVVHPKDAKVREIHVAGRQLHFVCGVVAVENVTKGSLTFTKIRRSTFYMYPEDALGGGVQSASIMWERIEILFQGIRDLIKTHGNARSGSFSISIPWTAACMSFIEVRFFVCQCIHC